MRPAALLLLFACTAAAHVGSPDVFHEGKAGPYSVLVAIRTPQVIPGVADVEIRASEGDVHTVRITPTPLTGPGAKFAPTADVAVRSKEDPKYFTGSLWMMTSGSWQVHVQVEGERGRGAFKVPVPAVANRTARMQIAMGLLLGALGALLSVGLVSIVGAATREAQLDSGVEPDSRLRRRSRWIMAVTSGIVIAMLVAGNFWWSIEAGRYDRYVYKPLEMAPALENGSRLVLRLRDPGWLRSRMLDDFIPDHTHLMHLYVIRLPDMERVWHLHPELREPAVFTRELPPMPAGRYQLYGDVVHANGFPETMTAEVELPQIEGKPLAGDDSTGEGRPVSQADPESLVSTLSDGYKMIWLRDPVPLAVKKPTRFRFRVEDAEGRPARDLELYMGMPGHAAFVKHDRGVFAHVHPSGSVPMAALALTTTPADPHAGHGMIAELPPEVAFPYGLPSPGVYRIYVQVKRAGKVETGVFDVRVP